MAGAVENLTGAVCATMRLHGLVVTQQNRHHFGFVRVAHYAWADDKATDKSQKYGAKILNSSL